MNAGQEKFFNFILGNVDESNQAEAKTLLEESFSKQADGTFNQEYLSVFIPKMLGLIKEEQVEQVKSIMMDFRSKLG